jgi:DNA polymerase-1
MNSTSNNGHSTTLDAARHYLRDGVKVVPVPFRSKGCALDGWPDLSLTEADLPRHFPVSRPSNIGLLTGVKGGGLVDVDLDCEQARVAAGALLPGTTWVSGRPSNPKSHRWYIADHAPPYEQFLDVDGKSMLVELQSTGRQTLVPPSLHPDGEAYVWDMKVGEPARVAGDEILRDVRRVAAAALIARHWPQDSRHFASLALAGGLFRAGWDTNQVEVFVRAVADAANDEESRHRVKNVASTARKVDDEEKMTGWPRLAQLLGRDGELVVRRVREWLNIRPGAGGMAGPASEQAILWGPVLPFGRDTPPPVFPVDIFPIWVRDFVTAQATATQTPLCAAGMLALGALSGGFGGKVRYQIRKDWSKAANLYVVVAMDPGERKSAVFKAIFAPVHAAEKAAIEKALPVIAAAESERAVKEARLKHLQNKAAKGNREAADGSEGELDPAEAAKELAAELAEFVVPPMPVLMVDDETLESLGKTLIDQGGRLLQAAAEGTAFEIAGGRYADDENFDVYLKAHDGDYFKTGRVSRGRQYHESPALTCALAVQPDVLRCLGRSARARGRGFLARWLYSVPMPMVGSRTIRPTAMTAAVRSAYDRTMTVIWETPVPPEPLTVPFSLEADDVLAAFEARVEPRLGLDGDLSGLAAWGTKLAGEVARIGGTLHMAEAAAGGPLACPGPVTGDAIRAAVVFAETYLIPHAVRAFGVMGADPAEGLAQRVIGWLVRNPMTTRFNKSVAFQNLKGGRSDFKSADLPPAFDLLVAHGYLRPAPHSGGPGRPPEAFEVNPNWNRTDPDERSPESPETTPPGGGGATNHSVVSPESPETPSATGTGAHDSGDMGDTLDESGAEPHREEMANPAANRPVDAMPMTEYVLVADAGSLEAVRAGLEDAQGERVYLDCETTGLYPRAHRVRLLSLSIPAGEGRVVYLVDCFRTDPSSLWMPLAGCEVVGHNLAFDLAFLSRLGFRPGRVRDTMLLSQVLYAAGHTKGVAPVRHGLKECAAREVGVMLDKDLQASDWSGTLTADQIGYAAADVRILEPLHAALSEKLVAARLERVAEIECLALPAVVWMAGAGVPFDRDCWARLAATAKADAERTRAALDAAAPSDPGSLFDGGFNWDSPEDVKRAFGLAGVTVDSTRDNVLATLEHPLAASLREYRDARKRETTYGLDWVKHVAADGRVYPRWVQLGANSGRMACGSPNMQNLPRGEYRRCFAAPPGRVLVKADYSQIELRIAAKVSGDKALMDAYKRGEDLHTLTAGQVLGIADVTKEHRQLAKALNFGLLYGMGAKGFRDYARANYGLELTEEQAVQYRAAFFRMYPGLRRWHNSVGDAPVDTRTLTGRRVLGIERFNEKLNLPVQGTGADGLKRALALLWERRAKCPTATPILAVHDEIVVEVPETDASAATEWLKRCMVDAVAPLIDPVPVEVEAKVGRTWGGD